MAQRSGSETKSNSRKKASSKKKAAKKKAPAKKTTAKRTTAKRKATAKKTTAKKKAAKKKATKKASAKPATGDKQARTAASAAASTKSVSDAAAAVSSATALVTEVTPPETAAEPIEFTDLLESLQSNAETKPDSGVEIAELLDTPGVEEGTDPFFDEVAELQQETVPESGAVILWRQKEPDAADDEEPLIETTGLWLVAAFTLGFFLGVALGFAVR